MTKQNKAFNFRLLPNREQAVLLAKTFGCVRLVYKGSRQHFGNFVR